MKNSIVVKDTQWSVVAKEVRKLKQKGWKEVGELQMVQQTEADAVSGRVQESLAFAQTMVSSMN